MPRMRNRDEDLARPRSRSGTARNTTPNTHGEAKPITIPDADEDWHPIARQLWDAILSSGQADLYESSDLAYAYFLVDQVSRYLAIGKTSGHFVGQIDAALKGLLLTEGARRQARVQLDPPAPEADTSRWDFAKARHKQRKGEPLTSDEERIIAQHEKAS